MSAVAVGGRPLLLWTVGLQLLAALLPLAIACGRGATDLWLPFLSQVAGSPPECGVFAFFMIPSNLLGLAACGALLPPGGGGLACASAQAGWLLVAVHPLGFTDLPNKHQWVLTVLCGHMAGALVLLSGCALSVTLQAALAWKAGLRRPAQTLRWALAFAALPAAALGIVALVALSMEEVVNDDFSSMKQKHYHLPQKFGIKYITTSCCEWILLISMWTCLFSFHREAKHVTISFTLVKIPLEKQLMISSSS